MENQTSNIQAYTIKQFCEAYGIPDSTLRLLLRNGKGPKTYKAGRRIYISKEAANAWRTALEAVS